MRIRVAISVVCLTIFSALSAQAQTQYQTPDTSNRATGENYHVEFGGYFWFPSPTIFIKSEELTQVRLGTKIDFVEDLGIENATFRQIKAVLRPGKKHKFRFEFTPIRYDQPNGVLRRNIVFNGILYNVALPVATELKWNAFRFTYEWDMIYRDRGFFGMLLETKYTDVQATLSNILDTEFARARAPIPSIGAIGRVYVVPNISITGELSGFKLPDSINEDYGGKFIDFDLYGSVNFTDHFGAQVGYRSFDVFYRVEEDEGTLKVRGMYFGGVVRF
jgi:hypothetical protein